MGLGNRMLWMIGMDLFWDMLAGVCLAGAFLRGLEKSTSLVRCMASVHGGFGGIGYP